FMTEFVRQTANLRIGHGLDGVDIGPMETPRELERLESLLNKAIEQGARLVTGGAQPELYGDLKFGNFFTPTIIEGCTANMDLYTQEVFGPVAPVYKVESFDEALRLTNE